jgi:hypothetical protein
MVTSSQLLLILEEFDINFVHDLSSASGCPKHPWMCLPFPELQRQHSIKAACNETLNTFFWGPRVSTCEWDRAIQNGHTVTR